MNPASVTLITGINGFCGFHLAERLKNAQTGLVIGSDLHHTPVSGLSINKYYQCDLCDPIQVGRLLSSLSPCKIFHLAGTFCGSDTDVFESNHHGTMNLLDAIRKYVPDCKTLLVGSAAEYGLVPLSDLPVDETYDCRPYNSYGMAKIASTRMALDYVERFGLKVIVARPFNILVG